MSDVGLTHVALPVRDLDASAAFYARYAKRLFTDQNGSCELRLGRVWHRAVIFHGALHGIAHPEPTQTQPQTVYLAEKPAPGNK